MIIKKISREDTRLNENMLCSGITGFSNVVPSRCLRLLSVKDL